MFRAGTGQSLHAYREGERLRAAVDFTNHNQLTARFRRRFGTVPSAPSR